MKKWCSFLYMVALGLVGCGGAAECTGEARPSLRVTVVDAVSGRPICDAAVAVSALNGNLDETLAAPGPTANPSTCSYLGPYERPGTFLVTATYDGYQMGQQSDVAVTGDGCHVQTVGVTLQLRPTPQPLR